MCVHCSVEINKLSHDQRGNVSLYKHEFCLFLYALEKCASVFFVNSVTCFNLIELNIELLNLKFSNSGTVNVKQLI